MRESTAFRNLIVESMVGEDVDPFADPEGGAEILQLVLDCFTAEELLRLSQLGE